MITKQSTPKIISSIAVAGLLLFLAVFIQSNAADSTSVTMANQKLAEAEIIKETSVVEPWRNDVGTLALEKAGQAKVAEQAAEAARIAEEAKQEAARQEAQAAASQAASSEQSCEEILAAREIQLAGVPSYQRPPMPCGHCAGYSSTWGCEQGHQRDGIP